MEEQVRNLENLIQVDVLDNFLEEDEIRLKKDEMTRLWELGVLSELAYVYLLLRAEIKHSWKDRVEKIDDSSIFPEKLELEGADIDYLMHKWRGITPKNEAGDVKFLSAGAIMKAFAALGKKEIAIPRSRQMTLFLAAEGSWTGRKAGENLTPIEDAINKEGSKGG